MTEWDPDEAYHRVERLFVRLCQVIRFGQDGLSEEWFANQLVRAAIPRKYLVSGAVAVDGTDVETWGALHGEALTVDLDGEATETQSFISVPEYVKGPRRRAKCSGSVLMAASATPLTPTLEPGTVREPTAAQQDRMSATSSIWVSRRATCAGPTPWIEPASAPRSLG